MNQVAEIKLFVRAPLRPRRRLTDDADIERIMRERLIEARQMNGMDQKEAAAALSYKNSSQLSKIESGDAPLPKALLRRASIAYGVSTDWLLGLSSEPERDPRMAAQMAVMRSVHASVSEHTFNLAGILLRIANDQLPLEAQLRSTLDVVKRATATFDRLCRTNTVFVEEIRGGSTVIAVMDELTEAQMSIDKYLSRRLGLNEARKSPTSMPLFDDQRD
jgi:transcriptional regulator with XRE-family HTH domain